MVEMARCTGHLPRRSSAAIDATGLETRHISRYFQWRKGVLVTATAYPKLTIVCDVETHFLLSAEVSQGPAPDGPQFEAAITSAVENHEIRQLFGDKGYDSERNHELCRKQLGIPRTVIPARRVPHGTGRWPKTKFRRQMRRKHNLRGYGQRWQVESVFSRTKRLLGSSLRNRTRETQDFEIRLRVLTHNAMLLAA